jgi:hypothetical protein
MPERILIDQFLKLLAGQFPSLLAYVAGMILVVTYWRRCPLPALLTLLALTLKLAATLLVIACFMVFRETQSRTLFDVVIFFGNSLHMVGYGLLLAAVFVGRTAKAVP